MNLVDHLLNPFQRHEVFRRPLPSKQLALLLDGIDLEGVVNKYVWNSQNKTHHEQQLLDHVFLHAYCKMRQITVEIDDEAIEILEAGVVLQTLCVRNLDRLVRRREMIFSKS